MQVSAADVQDRDGAVPLLRTSRRWFPFIERAFVDTAYAGERVANATRIIVEIVRKLPDQVGFTVLPRRWVVERFFAWLGRNRRLAKDFEVTIRLSHRVPLRRGRHALGPQVGSFGMRFESDSQSVGRL